MKLFLFIALAGFISLVSGNAYAKTTYIKCGYLSYKLDERVISLAKFYKSRAGKSELLPSDVDEKSIRYWLDEEHKKTGQIALSILIDPREKKLETLAQSVSRPKDQNSNFREQVCKRVT